MFNSTLEIIIKARDEASQTMSNFNSKLKGMEPTFKKMAVAGTVAFTAIAAGVASCLSEAIEAKKGFAQLDAVLASTKGIAGVTRTAALDLANSLAKVSLFTDDAILGGENLLLTFTNIGKDAFPLATQTMLDMSQALGQDLKSSATQLGKALQDPIKGVTALSKVGVNFTESQKEMIAKLVESGDLLGAQKIILAELNTEFGKSAENAAKADPFAMMKKSMGELKESIGTALLPAFEKIIAAVTPLIEKFSAWAQANPELLSKLVLIGGALAGIVAVVGTLGVILPSVIAGFTLLAGPVGIIIGLVAALTFAVVKIIGIFTLLRDHSGEVWTGLKIMFKEAIDSIVRFFDPLVNVIQKVESALARVGQGVANVAKSVGSKISNVFSGGKAQGGMVSSGSSYLVGEHGPELFTPGTSGAITANNKMGGGSGSTIVNIMGGTYLSREVANEIGDMIIQSLRTQMRGA